MKTGLLFAFVSLIAGLVSFGLTRWMTAGGSGTDEMTWLRQEFALTDTQAVAIERLHDAYRPVCTEHCARILALQSRLSSVAEGSDAHATATRELADLTRICAETTRRHLEDVAAQMSPAQGARYLNLVGSKVAQHGHAGPVGLR